MAMSVTYKKKYLQIENTQCKIDSGQLKGKEESKIDLTVSGKNAKYLYRADMCIIPLPHAVGQ